MTTKTANPAATTTTPRPVGRPKLPAAERLNRGTKVGLNPAETASVNAAAMKARVTRSAWIRAVILRAADNSTENNAHTENA